MANQPDNVDRDFYNVFDGTKGRPDSSYLDMQERVAAERLRAQAEGREVETDLGKIPAGVGTPLVVKANQVDNSLYSNPPMGSQLIEAKDVDPVATLSVSTGLAAPDVDLSAAAQYARERRAQEDALSEVEPVEQVEPEAGGPDNENSEFNVENYGGTTQ